MLAPDQSLKRSLLPLVLDTYKPYSAPTSEDAPVVNLRFRHTLHRILNDKPVSIVQDGTTSPTSATPSDQDTSAIARIRRMRARIRQRQRELTQTSTADEARLAEDSDEEREVGMPQRPRV